MQPNGKSSAGSHFDADRQTTLPRNSRVDLMDDWERSELLHMIDYAKSARYLHEPLYQLVDRGPVWDGDVISKSARDQLLAVGACAKIYHKSEDGFNAATYFGGYLLSVFDWLFGSMRPSTVGALNGDYDAETVESPEATNS